MKYDKKWIHVFVTLCPYFNTHCHLDNERNSINVRYLLLQHTMRYDLYIPLKLITMYVYNPHLALDIKPTLNSMLSKLKTNVIMLRVIKILLLKFISHYFGQLNVYLLQSVTIRYKSGNNERGGRTFFSTLLNLRSSPYFKNYSLKVIK